MKKILPYLLALGISSPAGAITADGGAYDFENKELTHKNLVLVGKQPVYCVENIFGCYLPIDVQDRDDHLDQQTRTKRTPYLLTGNMRELWDADKKLTPGISITISGPIILRMNDVPVYYAALLHVGNVQEETTLPFGFCGNNGSCHSQ